jgi:hypothetical protein
VAPEHAPSKKTDFVAIGAGTTTDEELVRGLAAQRFRSAEASSTSTAIGGYGEAEVLGPRNGAGASREWVADLPRFVVFVAHSFSDRIRLYSELEVEHGVACAGCKGEVEMEQAFLEAKVWRDAIGVRAGMILVPMGIINEWHEPPVFHGVLRPNVETIIIPSTWNDIGAGFFGRPTEPLRYELYAVEGLDPTGLSSAGLGGAKQDGSLATAKAWAVTGRVEYEPLLGVVLGASGYASDAGRNADFYDHTGQKEDVRVPILGWDVDARWRRSGLEWKVLYAEWHLPNAGQLMGALDVTGQAYFPDPTQPIGTVLRGGYVEGAYDVLRPFGLREQLLPFVRIEAYDTQSAVPNGFRANPALNVRQYTAGFSFRPLQQIVVKADVQLREHRSGEQDTQINFGLGFMY